MECCWWFLFVRFPLEPECRPKSKIIIASITNQTVKNIFPPEKWGRSKGLERASLVCSRWESTPTPNSWTWLHYGVAVKVISYTNKRAVFVQSFSISITKHCVSFLFILAQFFLLVHEQATILELRNGVFAKLSPLCRYVPASTWYMYKGFIYNLTYIYLCGLGIIVPQQA